MTDPNAGSSPAAAPPLEEDVATDRETEVRIDGFSVTNLRCPSPWDPSGTALAASYTVFDPNGQIRRGRLAFYRCPPPETDVSAAASASDGDTGADDTADSGDSPPPDRLALGTELGDQTAAPGGEPDGAPLHTVSLAAADLTHGDHTLPAASRWDGRLADGSRVSALDGPLWVRLEAWNGDAAEPPADSDTGPSVSRTATTVAVDVVVSARWSRSSVIPAGDPDEESRGKVTLDLHVKNVPAGTAVRLLIARIGTIDQPATDRIYERSGRAPAEQPGLEHLVVRNNRVVDGNNHRPEVVFSNFAEHWKYPGNNFYAAYLSVGDGGRWTPVTVRDHRNHEPDCLHMRFTVLVHIGSSDLPERTQGAQRTIDFLNQETRYFHAIGVTTPMTDPETYHRRFRHRYIVAFLGHCFNDCWHEDHPRSEAGNPIDHPHVGFDPDRLVCPDAYLSDAARAEAEEESHHYAWPIQLGCGNNTNYRTMPVAGNNLILINNRDMTMDDPNYVQVGHRGPNRQLADAVTIEPGDVPRFYFHCAGCRTALTDSLIGWFNRQGTRYAHGWVYTVDSGVNASFLPTLFRRWIKETGSDLGLDEWDPERFVRVYGELSGEEPFPWYQPRLRSAEGRLSFPSEPDRAESALA